jgi:hypothetical protein
VPEGTSSGKGALIDDQSRERCCPMPSSNRPSFRSQCNASAIGPQRSPNPHGVISKTSLVTASIKVEVTPSSSRRALLKLEIAGLAMAKRIAPASCSVHRQTARRVHAHPSGSLCHGEGDAVPLAMTARGGEMMGSITARPDHHWEALSNGAVRA